MSIEYGVLFILILPIIHTIAHTIVEWNERESQDSIVEKQNHDKRIGIQSQPREMTGVSGFDWIWGLGYLRIRNTGFLLFPGGFRFPPENLECPDSGVIRARLSDIPE